MATAWTEEEQPEEQFRKVIRFLSQKQSFLAVIYPISFVAKLTGISGISVNYRDGRYFAELSSKFTMRYSYGILIYSIAYQMAPMYMYYKQYSDSVTLLYLVLRTLITTAIHYR